MHREEDPRPTSSPPPTETPEKRAVERYLFFHRTRYMRWFGAAATAAGVWLSAEMHLPNGEFRHVPDHYKTHMPAMTLLCLYGTYFLFKHYSLTHDQLNDLAFRGKLHPVLDALIKEHPEKREELEAVGREFSVRITV